MRVMFVGLLLVGCHGTDITTADSQPPSDATGGNHALRVTWTSAPLIPGDVSDTVNVTSATFKIQRVQAIGDAGGSSVDDLVLGWSTEASPGPLEMPSAPPGIYSKVTLDVDGGTSADIAYEIQGVVKLGGTAKRFRIQDRDSLGIEVKDFDVTLPPDGQATLPIELDLDNALDNIEYADLDNDGGVLVLDNSDSQMPSFRDDLKQAFKRAN